MENVDINPKEIVESIRENLQALREANHDNLSEKERIEMKAKILELKAIALDIKEKIKDL